MTFILAHATSRKATSNVDLNHGASLSLIPASRKSTADESVSATINYCATEANPTRYYVDRGMTNAAKNLFLKSSPGHIATDDTVVLKNTVDRGIASDLSVNSTNSRECNSIETYEVNSKKDRVDSSDDDTDVIFPRGSFEVRLTSKVKREKYKKAAKLDKMMSTDVSTCIDEDSIDVDNLDRETGESLLG